MNIILVSIHLAAVFILVTTVLLQAGKGAGMGAAFGGSSGTVFGTRGPATFISKITCVAATVFMCTSLYMSLLQGGMTKQVSVMEEWQDVAPVASPVTTPASPAPNMVEPGSEAVPAAESTAVSEPAAEVPAAVEESPAPVEAGEEASPAQ